MGILLAFLLIAAATYIAVKLLRGQPVIARQARAAPVEAAAVKPYKSLNQQLRTAKSVAEKAAGAVDPARVKDALVNAQIKVFKTEDSDEVATITAKADQLETANQRAQDSLEAAQTAASGAPKPSDAGLTQQIELWQTATRNFWEVTTLLEELEKLV